MRDVRDINLDVVEELERPVPLEHHLYYTGFGIGKLEHLNQLRKIASRKKRKGRNKKQTDNNNADNANIAKQHDIIYTELIPYLKKHRRLPCLYFLFQSEEM